ncbi:MAG: glycosyltransferase family 39 protein [Saccharofermentans sp.]|nr:glycosyltransferase family 39 protein [Saccharofermentans sp.]
MNYKLTWQEKSILFLSTVVIMLFITCSSPLFAFNYWDDANVFFTMGRGIINGQVPYRDLYEQKGPILYFAHAVCALISSKTFIGVWLLEILMGTVFSFYCYKTVKLYVDPPKYAIFAVPAFLSAVYTIKMINYGDCAEELCFPILTLIMYITLRSAKEAAEKGDKDRLPGERESLIIGVLTGVLFWIKYTFLGAVIGLCIYMVLFTIKPKTWVRLLRRIGMFLAGIVIVTIPVLIYFAAYGALDDLWQAYFYNNIFLYSDYDWKEIYGTGIFDIPVFGSFVSIIFDMLGSILLFPSYGWIMLIIVIGPFLVKDKSRDNVLALTFITLFTCLLGVFTKPHIVYYYGYITMYLAPFGILVVIRLVILAAKVFKDRGKFIAILMSCMFVALCFAFLVTGKNMYMLKYRKEDYPQYRFAKQINEVEDATILTYDVMDSGYYLASDTLPNTPYFCYLNIEETWPVILQEQHKMIANGEFDFIIAYHDDYLAVWDKYEIVDYTTFVFRDYTGDVLEEPVYLYKLKAD